MVRVAESGHAARAVSLISMNLAEEHDCAGDRLQQFDRSGIGFRQLLGEALAQRLPALGNFGGLVRLDLCLQASAGALAGAVQSSAGVTP